MSTSMMRSPTQRRYVKRRMLLVSRFQRYSKQKPATRSLDIEGFAQCQVDFLSQHRFSLQKREMLALNYVEIFGTQARVRVLTGNFFEADSSLEQELAVPTDEFRKALDSIVQVRQNPRSIRSTITRRENRPPSTTKVSY